MFHPSTQASVANSKASRLRSSQRLSAIPIFLPIGSSGWRKKQKVVGTVNAHDQVAGVDSTPPTDGAEHVPTFT